jgi:hypothetical protein
MLVCAGNPVRDEFDRFGSSAEDGLGVLCRRQRAGLEKGEGDVVRSANKIKGFVIVGERSMTSRSDSLDCWRFADVK